MVLQRRFLGIVFLLTSALQRTVIRLHSSAAYPTTRSPIFTPSYSASQRCLSAVESILSLITYLKSTSLLSTLGPPFAFTIWVAARVLLVHGSTISQNVNPSIHTLVQTLRTVGQHWRVAERYAALLTRVLDEYETSQRAPLTEQGERPTPSTVRILADMRRCAFDLDFLISRQPKGVERNGTAGGPAGPTGHSRYPSVTPARTPQPVDFEYLDVFDFFNVPRLPPSMEGMMAGGTVLGPLGDGNHSTNKGGNHNGNDGGGGAPSHGLGLQQEGHGGGGGGGGGNEFNITNFSFDANSDWFGKPS